MVSTAATTPATPRRRPATGRPSRKPRPRGVLFAVGHPSGPLGAFRGVPRQASGWPARMERSLAHLPY